MQGTATPTGNLIGQGNEGVGNKKSSAKVVFKGYRLNLPSDYMYEIDGDTLYIMNSDETWLAEIILGDGSYSAIAANKNQIKGLLEELGYEATTAYIKNLGGKDFVISTVTASGDTAIVGYTQASLSKVFFIAGYTVDSEADESVLEAVGGILKDVEYVGNSKNMSVKLNAKDLFVKVDENVGALVE